MVGTPSRKTTSRGHSPYARNKRVRIEPADLRKTLLFALVFPVFQKYFPDGLLGEFPEKSL
jgi:hypothetical protein